MRPLAIHIEHHPTDEYMRERHVSEWRRMLCWPVLAPGFGYGLATTAERGTGGTPIEPLLPLHHPQILVDVPGVDDL